MNIEGGSADVSVWQQQDGKSPEAFILATSHPFTQSKGAAGFEIRAASSCGERSSASILINRRYASRGYSSNPLPEKADPNLLTLVAYDQDSVVGTLTVGFDSDRRLLADDLFPDEVGALRDSGRDVCEFTKLALEGVIRSQHVLAAMFHLAFIHAHRIRGCDNVLIEVNPRHVRYYESKLGFRPLGPQRTNRRVNAPAVLLSLDLWHANEQIRRFGGKPGLSNTERSLYPFGFSEVEEEGIVLRLQAQLADHARSASHRSAHVS